MASAADRKHPAVADSASVPQFSVAQEVEDVQASAAQEAPNASAVQEAQEGPEAQEAQVTPETQRPQEVPKNQEAPDAEEASNVQEDPEAETQKTSKETFDRTSFGKYRATLSEGEWSLLENDPVVITGLIRELGIKGVRMEEIWGVKEHDFKNLRPVHGLIFLLKHPCVEATLPGISYTNVLDRLYFAKQVINNACQTQAILSILMNIQQPDVELGEELQKLKDYSMIHDPLTRGIALGDATAIRNAHNAVAERFAMEVDNQTSAKADVQHHFISYMRLGDSIYEMDGLKDMPHNMGRISPQDDWLELLRPIFMRKISFFMEMKIFFSIMAVVSDKETVPENELNLLDNSELDVNSDEYKKNCLKTLAEYKKVREQKFRLEKVPTRHNYYPYLVALYKLKQKEKKLTKLLEKFKVLVNP